MKRYQLLIRALVCTILLTAPAVASAQLPGAASSMSSNPARTQNLSWPLVTGATYYQIWVTDSSGVPRYQRWHTATDLGCGAGQTTTCQISLSMYLLPGTATWWVQTWNATGYGPWSSAHTFQTPGPLFAVVGAAGVLARGNAASASKHMGATGQYLVRFHRDVSGCAFNVTLGVTDTAAIIPGGFATAARHAGVPSTVYVITKNTADTIVDRDFHLIVVCG